MGLHAPNKFKMYTYYRGPESHLAIHLPCFYHLNSKNIQYAIFFSIEHRIDIDI